MGAIVDAFVDTFQDNVDADKADCRALGQVIEDYLAAPYTLNDNAAPSPTSAPTGMVQRLIGVDAQAALGVIDAFGGLPALRVRRAQGTGASPSQITRGVYLGAIQFAGYYTSGGSAYSDDAAILYAKSTEIHTSTAQGTQLELWTTPDGTTTRTLALVIGQDQSVRAKGALGYVAGQGAGGTVSQATSRTTGVTLNAVTGQITLFNGAGLTTLSTSSRFTLTNNKIAANDTLAISLVSSPNNLVYLFGSKCAPGSADIWLMASATTAEAAVLQFAVIKGATN
jgi:hypothetical protein